mmetsp:Transcript_20484/g.41294  ORF Transcript_20484/g.41294 Transcript_20484/m.41294 type:complete len:85 (-) Transcript_20484:674-928(-)
MDKVQIWFHARRHIIHVLAVSPLHASILPYASICAAHSNVAQQMCVQNHIPEVLRSCDGRVIILAILAEEILVFKLSIIFYVRI